MYLIYVDESGDVGLGAGSSQYFILSGFVVHELSWHQTLDAVVAFRRALRTKYGLKLREEIHASNFIHKPGDTRRIAKSLRLRLLRDVLEFQASLPDVNILNVVLDKRGKASDYDVFDNAWRAIVQRFHNTISRRNFPGPQNTKDLGLLKVDQTDEKKLRNLTRRLRVYNPIPNRFSTGYRQLPLDRLVADAVHRNSRHALFLQLSDVNAFFLMQKLKPCRYVHRQGGRNYFDRLGPVLCKVASSTDLQGIVRL